MVTDWSRGGYSRPPQWQPERGVVDHMPDDGRLYAPTTPIRPPPDTIHNALRERCHLPVKSYICAVITDDDDVQIFSSLENLPDEAIRKFFNKAKFEQIFRGRSTSATHGQEDPSFSFNDPYCGDGAPDFASRRRMERRRDHRLDRSDDDLPPYNTRKRQRAHLHRRGPEDDDPPIATLTKKSLRVGDGAALWDFYGQRFKGIQQNACKLIAKAWVKAVAPKKQTNNPYTAGDEKAPDWWPKPWGTTKDDKVRHIEPDHLLKKERVHLLIHILRMIIEPNATQHPDIQKLNITVAKLEEVTTDALSSFFNDSDKNNNSKKKPYIREIFKVAKAEEQFKRLEIGKTHPDANTKIYVMADDKIPDNYQSDDDLYQVKEEEAIDNVGHSERVSPPKTGGPHSIMSASSSVHSPATNLHGTPFMADMPLRGPQYSAPMMPSDLPHSYVEGGNMNVAPQTSLPSHGPMHMQDMMPGPHDTGRRPSLYNTQSTDFPSPTGTTIYTNTSWQQTTAPGSGGLYTFPPPQPQPGSFVGQPGVSLGPSQPYLGSPFNLPHPQALTDAYRSSPVGQNGQGYTHYMGHDGRPLSHGLKLDPPNRGPLHQ